jgi:very-short-patch-repair endonuclease
VDLGWPEYRLAVEYDGLWHVGSGEQMHRDRQRLNRLVGAGWLVLHVTARQLREGFPQVLTEVREALLARGCPRSELSSRGRRIRAAAASGITAVSKKQGPSRAG